jgi:hypothetical protein
VQLIYAEPRGADLKVSIITRGGAATGEDRESHGNNADYHRVRKATENTPTFDAKKERQIFEEERKDFKGDQGSSSKKQPKIKEYGMPQAFDRSTSPTEGKEVSKLMEFVCTCVKLIQDKSTVQELQDLIKQYELGKIDSLLNRVVHQIGKRIRTNK